MRKVLISALVMAVCLGLGGTAFALASGGDGIVQPAAFTDIAGHEAETSLTLLGALGIYTGDAGLGGAVKPDDPITRAQFCKVVVTAMGRGTTAAGLAGLQPTFTDGATIPTWAWGYVNVAVYMGIISGYADGSFGPNNPVTYAEAVTMLIRAVPGHAAQVGAGVWPYNFLFYGVDNGFAGNDFTGLVDVGFASLPCTRGDAARLVVATMGQPKLDKDGKVVDFSSRLFLANDVLSNYSLAIGRVFLQGGGTMALADKVWLVGGKTYDDYLGLPVFVAAPTYEPYGAVVIAKASESSVVSGVFMELGDTDEDYRYDCFVLKDGTKVPYAEDPYHYGGPDADPGDWGHQVRVQINNEAGWTEHDLADWGSNAYTGSGAECTFVLGADGNVVNVIAVYFESALANDWDAPYSGGGYDYIEKITPPEDYDPDDYTTWTTLHTAWSRPDGWWTYFNYAVPDTCSVTINGAPAKVSDLRDGDVIDVAIDEWAHLQTGYWYIPYIIRAHREVVDGVVTAKSETFPGEVHTVTLKLADGTSKTYTLNDGVIGNSDINYDALVSGTTHVQWGLDFEGRPFENLGFTDTTLHVMVLGAEERTGDGTTYYVTVDNKGVTETYQADDADFVDMVGWPSVARINGTTGRLTYVASYGLNATPATVLALGADSATLNWGGTILFVEKLPVYADPNGWVWAGAPDREGMADSTYIGLSGLKVGQTVRLLFFGPDLKMLVRDDTPVI